MYDALWDRGIAIGYSDIRNDTILYRYRDETFEFPTSKVYHLSYGDHHGWNGYFYTAPIEKLRALKQELEKTP